MPARRRATPTLRPVTANPRRDRKNSSSGTWHPASEFGYTGDHVPLIRALVMAPNNEGVAARAGIDLIDEIRAFTPVEHVIADLGYTYATAEKWTAPLTARGIHQTLDLHPNQTGPQPGPANLPSTEFNDGGLFSPGMPDRLRRIKRIPRFQGVAGHLEQVVLCFR